MSLTAFNESYKPKHVASVCDHAGATEFPFEDVIAHLDGQWEKRRDYDAVESLGQLLEWLVAVNAKDNRGLSPIATRTLAAVWVVKPALLGNAPAHIVAKAFGISHQKFSLQVRRFSTAFKIQNQFQTHDPLKHKRK